MPFTQKFYTADLHFCHRKILESCSATRPYTTAEEMDTAIVEIINARCGSDDLLYILGDFALSGNGEYVTHLFHSIKPRKTLILGNHDLDNHGRPKKVIADLSWDRPPTQAMETKDGGHRVWLSHYGHRSWPASNFGSYHFFGHSHGNLPPMGRSRDVGIDVPDTLFSPRTFAELTGGMA